MNPLRRLTHWLTRPTANDHAIAAFTNSSARRQRARREKS